MTRQSDIGTPPWSREDLISAYPTFKEIYAERPIYDNQGGMKAPHAFATWFMVSQLKPSLIVESGVWRGQGTWLLEMACPEAELVCLDVNFSRLDYKARNATYIERDFSLIDFGAYDLSDALCFFDDHQSALVRLQQMMWKGFDRAIFEDNYPDLRGDCYSAKKMLGEHGFVPESQLGNRWLHAIRMGLKATLGNGTEAQPVPANAAHAREFRNNVSVYYEAPPLFKTPQTRWGDNWTDVRYPTKRPLFDETIEDDLRPEAQAYNWMCYIELASRA